MGRLLVRGGLTLGGAVSLERGCNFLANLLAARAAGPQVFGAYAIVLATAGTVATYSGSGIGTTANRFAGQYPREGREYRSLLRALAIVSIASAVVASALMFVGAEPLARVVLQNEGLTNVLRLSAFSAGAMILLECCRGLLIGQQKFPALLLLSVVLGLGLLFALPTAAHINAGAMITAQAGVALLAIAICIFFARQLGVAPLPSRPGCSDLDALATTTASQLGVGSVFMFGLMQLGSVISLSIAGWWITSLVARADATLVQLGVYAVANQLRQLVHIIPDLLTRVCYPLLTKESGEDYGGPDRVMLVNTFVTIFITLVVAGIAVAVLPWVLLHLYGRAYAGGEMPAALLLATGVIHMAGAPATNRVNIIALRAVGVINALWTALLIAAGIMLVPAGGAAGASATFLIAHVFSASSVLVVLKRRDALPRGLLKLFVISIGGAFVITGFAYLRVLQPSYAPALMCTLGSVLILLLLMLVRCGQKEGWVPRKINVSDSVLSRMNKAGGSFLASK